LESAVKLTFHVRLENITRVLKIQILWDVMPWGMVNNYRYFRRV
jgi:hypothetical protein